jgi:hypothetical protein
MDRAWDYDADRPPPVYSAQDVQYVESGIHKILNTSSGASGLFQASRTTLLPPGASVDARSGSSSSSNSRDLGEDIFPALMDDDLKLRLSRHPLVETLILILGPRILSKSHYSDYAEFSEYLKTYGLFPIGMMERGTYSFSLDAFYKDKLDEKIREDENRYRKKQLQEMLDKQPGEGGKKKKQNTITNSDLEEDAVYENRNQRQLEKLERRNMFAYPESDPESDVEMDRDPEVDAMNEESSWADAQDEDIQAFVDDRLHLIVRTQQIAPFIIQSFKFVLGKPIKT